jgi:outer membrane protein assembly factor BamD
MKAITKMDSEFGRSFWLNFFLFCILTSVFCLLTPGCAWFKPKPEKTAEELARDGMKEFKDEDYHDAIEAFQKLKDWYPFSKYAILAELKIADSHFELGEYEAAVAAYENFENLHPRNEAIPYVIYQEARCHFERIDTIDRDQTNAEKALEIYNRLIKQYPSDPYAYKAFQDIKKCHESLAGHQIYVGKFYFKNKKYEAALNRFQEAMKYSEADKETLGKADYYIRQCMKYIREEG